tara:strand:+ start:238 stop:1089 length:852 start_codon:yes stop_codon:yes gene_type:complete
MAEFPSLPLFTDAYLADTDHLTFEEHGIYLRLLMMIWRNPECRIPNDHEWICRRFRVDKTFFDEKVKPIMEEYLDNTGNWISKRRLQREYKWVKEKSKKNRASAKSRWNKDKGVSDRNAPIPIPIVSKKEDTKVSSKENKKPPKKQTRNTGSKLPADWQLNDADYQFAMNEIGEQNVEKELACFKDYWSAKPGAGGRKSDWSATWRNWCRRSQDFGGGKAKGKRSGAGDVTTAVRSILNGSEVQQSVRSDRVRDQRLDVGREQGHGDQSDLVLLPAGAKRRYS